MDEKSKIVLDYLNKMQYEQMSICSKNGRTAIYAIVGSIWGLIIKGASPIKEVTEEHDKEMYFALLCVLAIAILYLGIEMYRQYLVANEARKLHEKVLRGMDPFDAEIEMNDISDKSFGMFKYQLGFGILMVALLAVFATMLIF